MRTVPPPPRVPSIPAPPRMPSLVPQPAPVMTELADEARDSRAPPRSGYPSGPPSTRPSSRPSSPPPSSRRSVPPAVFGVVAAAMMPACSVATRSEPPPAIEGAPFTLAQLDITEGSVREVAPGQLRIAEPKVRAVAAVASGDAAELHFTYRGETSVQVPLDSGEHRQQLGLKLRAEDPCNLLYVMWEIAPVPKIVVRLKRNPTAHTSAACGANGYRTLEPEWRADAPPLREGATHALDASIEEGVIYVRVDGKVVWQGAASEEVLALHGPVGMRTDNVALDVVTLVPIGRQAIVPVR